MEHGRGVQCIGATEQVTARRQGMGGHPRHLVCVDMVGGDAAVLASSIQRLGRGAQFGCEFVSGRQDCESRDLPGVCFLSAPSGIASVATVRGRAGADRSRLAGTRR